MIRVEALGAGMSDRIGGRSRVAILEYVVVMITMVMPAAKVRYKSLPHRNKNSGSIKADCVMTYYTQSSFTKSS